MTETGMVLSTQPDPRIAELQREVRELRVALATERATATEVINSVSEVRRQLSPLYKALKSVFGEMDALGLDEPTHRTDAPMTDRVSAVWASWKSRLGGGCAKVIDALLLHGEMNTQQLAIATGLHRTTIPKLIYSLNKAGLLNKNGHRFSLKALA